MATFKKGDILNVRNEWDEVEGAVVVTDTESSSRISFTFPAAEMFVCATPYMDGDCEKVEFTFPEGDKMTIAADNTSYEEVDAEADTDGYIAYVDGWSDKIKKMFKNF